VDDADGGAVFHAASGIQIFKFGEDVGGAGGNQPPQSKDGSATDEVGDVVGNAQMRGFRVFQVHATG
jgi:hypothetical protein